MSKLRDECDKMFDKRSLLMQLMGFCNKRQAAGRCTKTDCMSCRISKAYIMIEDEPFEQP